MINEEQAAVRGISAARAANQQALPIRFAFDAEQRAMLMQHYAGQAMQAAITLGYPYGPLEADNAVAAAHETILAIERFYTLAVNPSRGNG